MLDLRITCGRGTYIRSLARQIGEALGTGGYLARLVRTAVGPYKIEDAIALADVPEPLTEADLLPLPDPVQPELDPKSGPEAVANESQSQGLD